MNFSHRCRIPVDRAVLWDFLMDIPTMAACVPGVEQVEPRGTDEYSGRMRVRIGPISLTLEGVLTVREHDEASWQAVVRADAQDRKIGGGLHAEAFMLLEECDESETELLIDAEVRLLGKLGEFGQPVIRRKAEATLAEFARNVAAQLGSLSA